MFFPEGAIRVHVYGQPVDMRKSFDGLYALTRQALGCDPLSGERNRSLSGVLCPPAPTRNNPSHIHQGGAGSDQGDSDQQQVAAA